MVQTSRTAKGVCTDPIGISSVGECVAPATLVRERILMLFFLDCFIYRHDGDGGCVRHTVGVGSNS